jgi:hypothetical protein
MRTATFVLAGLLALAATPARRTSGRCQEAGRVRHRGRAKGAVAGSHLPLGARTQIDPSYAAALNNLAIRLRARRRAGEGRSAYEKALELEPGNALIKQNYELFREINDRATRKDSQ